MQRPVDQRALHVSVELGPVLSRDGRDKEVGVVGRIAGQGQESPIARIESDDSARFAPFRQE